MQSEHPNGTPIDIPGYVKKPLRNRRRVVWRSIDGSILESCLTGLGAHYRAFQGNLLCLVDNQVEQIEYSIRVDKHYGIMLSGRCTVGASLPRRFEIRQPFKGRWERPVQGVESESSEGPSFQEIAELWAATDLDLECSPVTNTLAINRLALDVGESADIVAAWVRFPALTVEPLPQTYTRLAESTYLYQDGNGFSADLEVDDLGLVVRYGEIWERVAVSDGE